jgi:hypothetical protein
MGRDFLSANLAPKGYGKFFKKKSHIPYCKKHPVLVLYPCIGELGLFKTWILGSAQSIVEKI